MEEDAGPRQLCEGGVLDGDLANKSSVLSCHHQPIIAQCCHHQPITAQYCMHQPITAKYCHHQPITAQYCHLQPITAQYSPAPCGGRSASAAASRSSSPS